MSANPGKPQWTVDTGKASVARVYDYVLGGKDNFAVDRVMGDRVLADSPDAVTSARLNREFGRRVTEYAARQGIAQFVDLGSGIPTTPPSVHETARAIVPGASVVYVDHDPVVAAHSRAWRGVQPGTATVLADLTDPAAVLSDPDLTAIIDLSRPVAVSLISVLQTIVDDKRVAEVLAGYREHMVPGSFLALSHISAQHSAPDALDTLVDSGRDTGYPPLLARDDASVERFFTGFDLLEPGIVDIKDWWPPEETREYDTLRLKLVGGLGIRI